MLAALAFYFFAAILIASAVMVIAAKNPVHSVLFLILAFFNAAGLFVLLGAEFLAMILVVVYVGAVAVLFLFVVMMLNLGKEVTDDLRRPTRSHLIIPGILVLLLLLETALCFARGRAGLPRSGQVFGPEAIGRALYDQHYLGVELSSLILLIGIIGGMHLGRAASVPDTVEKPI